MRKSVVKLLVKMLIIKGGYIYGQILRFLRRVFFPFFKYLTVTEYIHCCFQLFEINVFFRSYEYHDMGLLGAHIGLNGVTLSTFDFFHKIS